METLPPVFQLPLELQWEILNTMYFPDLVGVCLAISCPAQYFLFRLKSLGISTRTYWGVLEFGQPYNFTERLFPNYLLVSTYYQIPDSDRRIPQIYNQPVTDIDRYVMTVVYETGLDKDPGVVDYITGYNLSSILEVEMRHLLFYGSVDVHLSTIIIRPGIEFFIGIIQAAERAIKLRNMRYMSYLLTLYPTNWQLPLIIAKLYLEYLTTGDRSLQSPELFRLLPSTGLIREGKFYPVNEREYRSYLRGRQEDAPYPLDLAYLYGTIDGGHDERFMEILNSFPPHTPDLLAYILKNGTYRMIEYMMSLETWTTSGSWITNGVLRFAIDGNNFEVVDAILSDPSQKGTIEHSTPRSMRMLNLLKSHGVMVRPSNIVTGAFLSGDYDLFKSVDLDQVDRTMINVYDLLEAPSYMVMLYLDGRKDVLGRIYDAAIGGGNLEKAQLIRYLGYTPDSSPDLSEVANHEIALLIGFDTSMYPYLD